MKKKARAKAPSRKSQPGGAVLNAFVKAKARDAHPHLHPIGRAAFLADRDVLVAKGGSLLAYQRFLVDARTVKAARKGSVSTSFERNVLVQAQQASADLDAFAGSALRMAQQVNQTDMWSRNLAQTTRFLRDSGPTTLKAMWNGLAQSAETRTELAKHGVSPDIVAAVNDAMGKLDATASVRDGKVSIATRVAGESQPRRVALSATVAKPANVSELLRRSQFDQVVAAFAAGAPTYVEAVPAAGIAAYQPADLFAFSAVALRQRMTEHVRKLEDTGLATYEGNDPISFIVGMLALATFLGLIGTIILELCDVPDDAPVQQPDWVCAAGALLTMIALGLMGAIAAIFIIEGVAVAAIGLVGVQWLLYEVNTHQDIIFPGFNPSGAPA